MNESGYAPTWRDGIDGQASGRVWVNNGFAAEEEHPAVDPRVAFASLVFVGSALKRNARVWFAFALVGLLIGAGIFEGSKTPYQATAMVLLKENPNVDPSVAIQTDATLAQSTPLAGLVIKQLRLPEDASGLISSYTVLTISNNVLKFTVNASSGSAAVTIASALTADFLQYRASYYEGQQQQTAAELDQQFNLAQQHLTAVDAQIGQVSQEPTSADQQAKLNDLEAQRANYIQIEQYINSTNASGNTITNQMAKDSQVANAPTLVPRSAKRRMLEEIVGGLVAGLAIGLAVVIIQALTSERLWRRDDVADALGIPVKLSVRSPRKRRWLPGWSNLAERDMDRIAAHFDRFVPSVSQGIGGLAVVAVDNADLLAPAVVSLAASCARNGRKVVLADLAGGELADALGVAESGVQLAQVDGERVVAMVPEREELLPVGPLQRRGQDGRTRHTADSRANPALLTASASADLVLALADLDPASGADHLSTWVTDVVVVVTAGHSTATRIHAVGDMLRFAGVRIVSAVLMGSDKSDESLGVVDALDQSVRV